MINATAPLFDLEPTRNEAIDALQFVATPAWLAEAIVEKMAPRSTDVVVEPSCGDGELLLAIPPPVTAFGIEIDPQRAKTARHRSGRTIIEGDFRTVAFPVRPTMAIANPPFRSELVHALLERLHREFAEGGRAGLLIPAHFLSFVTTIEELRAKWSIDAVAVPRDGFPRISFALAFATFTKEQMSRLTGFAFVEDALDARWRIAQRFRRLLDRHDGRGSCWDRPIEEAIRLLGGAAYPHHIYPLLADPQRPMTESRKGKIRQRLQQSPRFERLADDRWALAA